MQHLGGWIELLMIDVLYCVLHCTHMIQCWLIFIGHNLIVISGYHPRNTKLVRLRL